MIKSENLKLEIFNGKRPPDDFIKDLEIFLRLEDNLKKEVIRNTFSWYPKEDIEEEWSKWMGERTKEEKERLSRAIKLILFIMKKGFLMRFTDDNFVKELKKIGFDSNLIEFFLSELNKNKENIVQKIEEIEIPVIPRLTDLKWRIDIKKSSTYSRKIDEPCVILKMFLSDEKTSEIVFELSCEELNSLMRTFSLIQKEIVKLNWR